jgi:regulator of sirC expression with transglutaminase-like and TPR domain
MTEANSAARERFSALLDRHVIPLDEAALAIASEEYPGLDPGPTMQGLDALAARVGAEVGDLRPPLRVLQAMRTVLRAEGFQGNEKDYYDPRNSFLNEVVARRLGIPITLSLVTIEVARRLGLQLRGVAFPGHFLVRCPVQTGLAGDIFIDAFNGWELLGSEECTARFKAVLHGRPFDPALLDPVDSRHILTRLLHNLKRIYVERGDDVRTLWVVDRLLQITPGDLEERRDRGLVSARLGGTAAAAQDLEAYVQAHPRASDADDVRELIKELGGRRTLLN